MVGPVLEEKYASLDDINMCKRMTLSEGGAPGIYLWSGYKGMLRYISVEKGGHGHWAFQDAKGMMEDLHIAAKSMPQAPHILGLLIYYDKVQRTTSRLHDFTTYDFTTFTTLRLLIDLETHFCTVNPVSRSIKSRKVVKVVKS